jgi:hypothetical protein
MRILLQICKNYYIFFPIFLVYSQLDPFYFIITDSKGIYIITFRWIFSVIVCLEICRMVPTIVSIGLITWFRFLYCTKIMDKERNVNFKSISRFKEILHNFEMLRLCNKFMQAWINNMTAFMMSAGLAIVVLSNLITFKFYNLLPALLYLFFPCFIFFMAFIAITCLPLVVFVFEASMENLQRLNNLSVLSHEIKYLRRRLRSLQPLCFSFSIGTHNIFEFVIGADVKYFKALLDQ